jgi:hypothetical protein
MEVTNSARPSTPVNYPDIYYIHTNLDMNTAQESIDYFDDNKTILLLDELVSNSEKISKKGIKEI